MPNLEKFSKRGMGIQTYIRITMSRKEAASPPKMFLEFCIRTSNRELGKFLDNRIRRAEKKSGVSLL